MVDKQNNNGKLVARRARKSQVCSKFKSVRMRPHVSCDGFNPEFIVRKPDASAAANAGEKADQPEGRRRRCTTPVNAPNERADGSSGYAPLPLSYKPPLASSQ